MNNDDTRFASRKDYDDLHEKVDSIALTQIQQGVDQARMEGKIDGMISQKGSDFTFFGMLAAIGLGIWNILK